MLALVKKEINSFFSHLTGYIVIIVYLLINSLILWIFPGQFNILDMGYASVDALFILSPWIFIFLVPAVTMRLIAEERASGTIEFLLTKPLSDFQIVFAKYSAGLLLVILSIVPTLMFLVSVILLGNPPGNIDLGGTWGSYLGLFFLASVYTAIGIFSSSLTKNQVIAFLISMALSFVFYYGFDALSSIITSGYISDLVLNFGINEHFKSMGRGVIDIRDVVYFISISALFLIITKIILERRK